MLTTDLELWILLGKMFYLCMYIGTLFGNRSEIDLFSFTYIETL
jgi:hypothetical protein